MTKKVSKPEAEYRPYPKATHWCSRCTMWAPPNGCTKVEGRISANGWCKHWYPKGLESKK